MSENNNNQQDNSSQNFGLPEGYFKRSAGNIMKRIEWEEEHKEYPVLSGLKGRHGFTVPDGYFLKSEARLEMIDFPALSIRPKHTGYALPQHYFEEAETLEYSKNFRDTSDELAGLEKLSTLPKQNNFKVGEDYFEVNAKLLASLLEHRRETRIIDLFFSRTAYVAAAMLVLALGLWVYSVYFTPAPKQDCGTLACIDRHEIFESKVIESFSDDDLMDAVDASDLETSMNGNPATLKTGADTNTKTTKNTTDDTVR